MPHERPTRQIEPTRDYSTFGNNNTNLRRSLGGWGCVRSGRRSPTVPVVLTARSPVRRDCLPQQREWVMADVDTIVIGSGAGGLAAAVALARAGQRVVVLEQHYLPGGWCHSFDLGGHSFSPGVHYIGDLGPGGRLRHVYEGLGVADDLVFLELDPDGIDKVQIGEVRFDIPKGKDRFADALARRFPHEAAGIRGFLDLMAAIAKEVSGGMRIDGPISALSMPVRCPNLVRYGFRPLSRVLDKFVSDPVVRAILCVQAGDHGVRIAECPTVLHAAVMGHYFGGGYYPKGGGRALPKAFIKALRRHGGQIRVRARVDRILTEGRRAIGVRLADGTTIRARQVISNADPQTTFGALLDPDAVPWRLRRRVRNARYSLSAVSLFMAADLDARAAGLDSGNRWYSRSTDLEAAYRYSTATDPLSLDLPGVFLTCTTEKDPSKRKDGIATMEAFTFVSWDAFAKHAGPSGADPSGGDRSEGYLALKEAIGQRMLSALDHIVEGLSDRLVFTEIGTPLTNRYYCEAHRGNLYGTEKQLRNIGPFGFPVDPPVDGLYLCGASTASHGVAGATYSGLVAARTILGCRTSELLTAKSDPLRIWPCDQPEAWPEPPQLVRDRRDRGAPIAEPS